MENQNPDKVEKTFAYIRKDRAIPENPWFYSRLVARMEREASDSRQKKLSGTLLLRLKPILAVMLITIGVAGGILLGREVTPTARQQDQVSSSFQQIEDVNAALFREVSGSLDEQLLLMK